MEIIISQIGGLSVILKQVLYQKNMLSLRRTILFASNTFSSMLNRTSSMGNFSINNYYITFLNINFFRLQQEIRSPLRIFLSNHRYHLCLLCYLLLLLFVGLFNSNLFKFYWRLFKKRSNHFLFGSWHLTQ